MAKRNRKIELLLLLAFAAVLASGSIERSEEFSPDIRALTIDGLLPGMLTRDIAPNDLSSSTVYRKTDEGDRIDFVFGQSIVQDDQVLLKDGDTKETVSESLGPPDRIGPEIWIYDRAFSVAFREEHLVAAFTDQLQRGLVSEYPNSDAIGLSHTAGWFYGCVGETAEEEPALILVPSLTETSNQMVWSSWTGPRVILESGTISVGQSIESARAMLAKGEAIFQRSRYSYSFNNDFVLTLGVDSGKVSGLKVEPQPIYGVGPSYDGVQGLLSP